MRSPAHTSFSAIFQTEVLLNSKRVAPYAMAVLFAANALLWWGWGPAGFHGWATNSEFYIVRNFGVYSFMTLPLFTALLMGDPVIRDFRTGVSPLIFSKPLSRATYLLGKFSGNFFVLVCCQLAFPLTLVLLQGFRRSGMIVQPPRLVPYFKHFLILVVVSHLMLAAFYFAVGTLTRSAKLVYGLAVSFYPVYIAYQVMLLKSLPARWRVALDPLMMDWPGALTRGRSAEWLNQVALSYDSDVFANRALMMLFAALCLWILHARFSMVERFRRERDAGQLTTINLATTSERLVTGAESYRAASPSQVEEITDAKRVEIPRVAAETEGLSAMLKQLRAALVIEFRLLYAERSLVVLLPLATLMCVLGVAYYEVAPEGSYSGAYASRTTESLMLFLSAIAIFYTGEAMHRDRELRVEPVLWSVPAPNFVLLLSKFAATLLLSLILSLTVGLTAIALQIYRGHAPVEISVHLTIYSLILIPSMVFLIAAATALNVLLRDKYLAYAVSFAAGLGLFYLFNQGYNGWLYNPLLYGLWTPSDVTGAAKNLPRILTHRFYCLAVATLLLALAHLCFERRATKGLMTDGRPSGKGWSILIIFAASAAAVFAGWMIGAGR